MKNLHQIAPCFRALGMAGALAALLSAQSPSLVHRFAPVNTAARDQFGFAVRAVGDLTGNGIAELAFGAPNTTQTSGKGQVYIYSYDTSRAQWARRYTIPSPSSNPVDFGTVICAVGDVNRDQIPDFAVADPKDSGLGAVYVFSGSNGRRIGARLGYARGTFFGTSVASVGDLTGDGIAEIAVGAPWENGGGAARAGRVFVFDIANLTWGFRLLYSIPGAQVDARSGFDLASNGDGVLAVGAWGDRPSATAVRKGGVRIYRLGAAAATLLHAYVPTVAAHGEVGRTVAAAGDVNGDGNADLIAGDPSYKLPANAAGAVVVFFGPKFVTHRVIVGNTKDALFGSALDGVGDQDGDGFGDLLVGEEHDGRSGARANAGAAYLLSGRFAATGQGAKYLFSVASNIAKANLGQALATAGDLDDDGIDEFLVAAPQESDRGRLGRGAAYLYKGGKGCIHGSPGVISAARGGDHVLHLEAPRQFVGSGYLVLGSATGTAPGLTLGNVQLPLNAGPYFGFVLNSFASSPLFDNFWGLMRPNLFGSHARAKATLRVPAVAAFRGITLHHSFVLADPARFDPRQPNFTFACGQAVRVQLR